MTDITDQEIAKAVHAVALGAEYDAGDEGIEAYREARRLDFVGYFDHRDRPTDTGLDFLIKHSPEYLALLEVISNRDRTLAREESAFLAKIRDLESINERMRDLLSQVHLGEDLQGAAW